MQRKRNKLSSGCFLWSSKKFILNTTTNTSAECLRKWVHLFQKGNENNKSKNRKPKHLFWRRQTFPPKSQKKLRGEDRADSCGQSAVHSMWLCTSGSKHTATSGTSLCTPTVQQAQKGGKWLLKTGAMSDYENELITRNFYARVTGSALKSITASAAQRTEAWNRKPTGPRGRQGGQQKRRSHRKGSPESLHRGHRRTAALRSCSFAPLVSLAHSNLWWTQKHLGHSKL